MTKRANPDHPVMEVVVERWSPYAFADRAVSAVDLKAVFEAASWAASSFNEQPWRYIVATRDDSEAYAKLLSCLAEANRAWAGAAPVLALGVARLTFTRNGKPNAVAIHDLGQASATLTLEATARGLRVHQMRGILPDRAAEVYAVPEGFEVVTALAIGYAVEPESIPEQWRKQDTAPRTRNPLQAFVFGDAWEKPAPFIS